MWQDGVIAACGAVFAVSLWPTVVRCRRRRVAPNVGWFGIVSTAGCLGVLTYVYGSLGLWWGATTTGFTAAAWVVLGILKGAAAGGGCATERPGKEDDGDAD